MEVIYSGVPLPAFTHKVPTSTHVAGLRKNGEKIGGLMGGRLLKKGGLMCFFLSFLQHDGTKGSVYPSKKWKGMVMFYITDILWDITDNKNIFYDILFLIPR